MAKAAKHTQEGSILKLRPLLDRVLIRPDQKQERISPGGIVLPDTAQRPRHQCGTVIAVGPGKPDSTSDSLVDFMPIEEGDRVVFATFSERVELNNEELVLIRLDDVYGVIETA